MVSKSLKAARRGFTLIEIMIVVLIIGILLAIAVPNFIKARETSRAKACVSNLKQLDAAKEQYTMDHNGVGIPTMADLCGNTDTSYIKGPAGGPTCPSGGNYTLGAIGVNPTCSGGPTHVLP